MTDISTKQRVSVYKLSNRDVDASVVDSYDYSMFKHGHRKTTIKFAKKLAAKLTSFALFGKKLNTEIYITGAPYNQVPVASTYLAQYVAMFLREFGFYNVKEFKINRQHSYHQDYGLMDAASRHASISGETFYTDAAILQDKTVLFIDDVLITGAHESRIEHMIEHLHIKCDSIFAYYAAFDDCCESPDIEHQMNSAAIQDMDDLTYLFSRRNLLINTRVTKFLLSIEKSKFLIILTYMTKQVKADLYRYSLANTYNTVKEYQYNFSLLQESYRNGLT